MDGKTWEEVAHDSIVKDILMKYNVGKVVADAPSVVEKATIKKPGMSDYQFVKGLGNLHGYYFKVTWDPDKNEAIGYWGESKTVFPQDVAYTFKYGDMDESTLLDFEPQFAMRGAPTGVKVTYYDQDTKSWELIPVIEDKKTGKLKYDSKGAPSTTTPEEIVSSSAFRITASGASVEVVPERPFQSPAQAQRWAEKWIRDRKDNFITARGTVVGLETLKPGQVHRIEGVGSQLTGDYEFTTVNHKFDSGGYTCEFFAHKVME
jgi:phage protein D